MVEQEEVRAPRRRVRTGCLTCRSRRRKCDEGKPECANCTSKGLKCRYGVNVTFVQSKFQPRAAPETLESPSKQAPSSNSKSPSAQAVPSRYSSPDDLFQVVEDPRISSSDRTVSQDIAYERSASSRPPLGSSTLSFHSVKQYHPSPPIDAKPSLLQVPTSSKSTFRRDQHEVELLRFYRYNVAPSLDLGLGSLSFGVDTVIDANESEAVYNAILAVASSGRAATEPHLRLLDEATSVSFAHFASQDLGLWERGTGATAHGILVYRRFMLNSVESWPSMIPEIVQIQQGRAQRKEQWALLTRLHLAALLGMTSDAVAAGSLFSPDPIWTSYGEPADVLIQTLWTVAQVLHASSLDQGQPLQMWLSLWGESQYWYAHRPEHIRQLFDMGAMEVEAGLDVSQFPSIIFSSPCAAVANTAHHLAAMALLQRKPRLARATAEHGSSTSALWHASRIMGIVASGADAGVWDVFLVAAFIYTTVGLSHGTQILAAIDTLQQLMALSGLRLENAVARLQEQHDGI